MTELSELQKRRVDVEPPVILAAKSIDETVWQERGNKIVLSLGQKHQSPPLRVGVVLSGGPAPGGHNVIWGLHKGLKELHESSKLIGFLGGPSGLIENRSIEITEKELKNFRNIGGFHLLGSGRTKIETVEQYRQIEEVISKHNLSGIVFIGGDDTNTSAALLANHITQVGISCSVIGIPKTIDCDMRGFGIETSFGFDTACKVYSEMIGNIAIDAASAGKYWFFVKVMGRKASHIALECALQTKPNLCFIGEEVEEKGTTLEQIITLIAETVTARAKEGKNYGVTIIPEGLIEFIPEFKTLIGELNRLLAENKGAEALTSASKELFESLPEEFRQQLMTDRDPHGNVALSHIETEKLIMQMVAKLLKEKNFQGKFQPVPTFMGYEARCADPSDFDAAYCYNLGIVASILVRDRKTGYMAGVSNLASPTSEWKGIGVRLAHMMTEEERKGVKKQVIAKVLVDLKGPVFKEFSSLREKARTKDRYCSPGPMQYENSDNPLISNTLRLESKIKA